MSRFRNTARSLASGYLAMGATVIYTLASVPLALHFLDKDQFGLWALAAQVASYLALIDLGVTGAAGRILIDAKDHRASGAYGSVIKTSLLVYLIQGLLVIVLGCALAFWLPSMMHVPEQYVRTCRILVAALCAMTGAVFSSRLLTGLLQAHQRFDCINYSQIAQLSGALFAQWIGFEMGLGVYSLLVGSAVLSAVGIVTNYLQVWKLRFFPAANEWGRATWATFKEIFGFGWELFLLSVGLQLLNASQVVIISRKLGLTAAAVWAVATKVYPLAFQLVSRIFDFSSSAFAEMVARGEREKLQRRFRDVFLLSASSAVFSGAAVAVCNGSFVSAWTKGKISWAEHNNLLLGLLLLITCVTRCNVGLVGPIKKIGRMRYVYKLQGILFVGFGFKIAAVFGMTGILVLAIMLDVLLSGVYGFWRTARYFEVTIHEMLFKWLANTWGYLLMMTVISAGVWWTTRGLGHAPEPAGEEGISRIYPLTRLAIQASMMSLAGMPLLWRFGLTAELRQELRARFRNVLPAFAKKPAISAAR
jgi:O-antigen/teichoic acid export membrane protein